MGPRTSDSYPHPRQGITCMIRDCASFTALLTLLFHSAKKLISIGSLVVRCNLKYLKFLQHDLLFKLILHGILCTMPLNYFCCLQDRACGFDTS